MNCDILHIAKQPLAYIHFERSSQHIEYKYLEVVRLDTKIRVLIQCSVRIDVQWPWN